MPKRTKGGKGSGKDSGKGSAKEPSKGSGKDARTQEAAADAAPVTARSTEGVDERGAFALARCDRCGWQGPARRSRERARKDLAQHLDDKPKHAPNVSLTAVVP